MAGPTAPSEPPPKLPHEVVDGEALQDIVALSSHRSSASIEPASSAKSVRMSTFLLLLDQELESLKDKLKHVHEMELSQLRNEVLAKKATPEQDANRTPSFDAELPMTIQLSEPLGTNSCTGASSNQGSAQRERSCHLTQSARMLSAELDMAQAAELDSQDGQQFELRKEFCMDQQQLLKLKKRRTCVTGQLSTHNSVLSGPERKFFHEGQAVEKDRHNCIMRPSSRARMCWDVLAMAVLTYDLFMVPASVFYFEKSTQESMRVLQIMCTIYWLSDIPATFFTAVYANNTLLTQRWDIAKEYLQTWFAFDIFVLIPDMYSIATYTDDVSAEAADGVGVVRALRAGRLLRLLRFLRLLRLFKLMKVLRKLIEQVNNAIILLALRIIKYGFMTIYLAHVLACLWFAIGDVDRGWVSLAGLQSMPSYLQYLRSVEFALSRLHPSAMQSNMELETAGERGLAIFASFLALGFSSFFISSITNTMADIERRRQRKKQLLQSVREYCSSHHISVTHAMSIKSYVEREHSRKKSLQAHLELLETLPQDMLRELFHEARSQTLQHHGFFDEMGRRDPPMEMDLCNKALSERFVLVSDKIFIPEQVAVNMYLLSTGGCRYEFDPSAVSEQRRKLTPVLKIAKNAQNRRTSAGHLLNLFANARRPSVVSQIVGDGAQTSMSIGPGDFVSEHTLWIEGWTHLGTFTAMMEGWLLEMNAKSVSAVLADHPTSLVEMVLYAKRFVDSLNDQWEHSQCVSDMLFLSSEQEDAAVASMKLPLFSGSFRPVNPAAEAFAAT